MSSRPFDAAIVGADIPALFSKVIVSTGNKETNSLTVPACPRLTAHISGIHPRYRLRLNQPNLN